MTTLTLRPDPRLLARALLSAADRADEWPAGHGRFIGKNAEGAFTQFDSAAVSFFSPEREFSGILGWHGYYGLSFFLALWRKMAPPRYYLEDLNRDPPLAAIILRSFDAETAQGLVRAHERSLDDPG